MERLNTTDKASKGNNETPSLPKPIPDAPLSFPVVGIGASAGGLEALEQFLKATPVNTNMAFVIIQHLDPTHVGMMPDLMQRLTTMKVYQASDGLEVKPNEVYVIPPNKSLSILHGKLHLFEPLETRGLRLPIDFFFKSLADDLGEKSIGIILSGMGSDGSIGIKAIKEKNGLVLVQDQASAKFDGMPNSAMAAVNADCIADPSELPAKLINLLKFIPQNPHNFDLDEKTKSNLGKIFILLRTQTGHDFSQYKYSTMIRRIERRTIVHQLENLDQYVRYLQENPKEVEILFKELLIGVTNFFRDPTVWQKMKEDILPNLIKNLPDGYTVRAWVVGCSSGEEAYSLAIIFMEAMEKLADKKKLTLVIFATDIDKDAIERGRKGRYSAAITADVSPDRINRFFKAESDGYRIISSIREMVVFATQNVIKDPPFTKLDLLFCRNMLIYMEPVLQKQIISLFNYSLNNSGILVLGTAETINPNDKGFDQIDSVLRIFMKSPLPFPSFDLNLFMMPKGKNEFQKTDPVKTAENLQNLTEQYLLQHFVPETVLVNDNGDILYITGQAGKYLEPAAGKANWNIHVMAREGLKQKLPLALRQTKQRIEPVILHAIPLATEQGMKMLDVSLQRIKSKNALNDNVIIVFNEVPDKPYEDNKIKKPETLPHGSETTELEEELKKIYADLQNTRIEMQISQEELKSTNEELQSTNEELQSSNEELTTSKEEMQSLNEELQTANNELQSRIHDFMVENTDIENLLDSSETATLFLDKKLNIRRFTNSINTIINIRKDDIGRPFTELVSDLLYPEIEANAKQVLKTLVPIESSNITKKNNWYRTRIMPYRTLDDKAEGLIIIFTNITAATNLEIALKNATELVQYNIRRMGMTESNFLHLFESVKEGVVILDANDGTITNANPYFLELSNSSKKDLLGKEIWEIGFFKNIVPHHEEFILMQQKEMQLLENIIVEPSEQKKINIDFSSISYGINGQQMIQCIIRSNTDIKTANTERLYAENRYRQLFDRSNDGIMIMDGLSGKIEDINPSFTKLLGFAKTELLGKPVWESGIFTDMATNKDRYAELKERKRVELENISLEMSNGQKITVDFSSHTYEEYNRSMVVYTLRDVSELKRLKEAIQETESTFKSFFHESPLAISYQQMLYDKDGKAIDYLIIDANKMFNQLVGEDTKGKRATEIFPDIKKDAFDWMGSFAKQAKSGKYIPITQHFPINKEMYICVAYQTKMDFLVTTFLAIPKEGKP